MMITKVYFEKFGDTFVSDFIYNAYDGFAHIGGDKKLILFDDIEEVPVSKNNMVIACIETTETYLKSLGVTIPDAINIPECLYSHINRSVRKISLDDFLNTNLCPVFVKPLKLKYCKSGVINKDSMKSLVLSDAPKDAILLISDPVDIVNEYRVFVNRGKILGIRQYNVVYNEKEHFYFLDEDYVMKCIKTYLDSVTAPISFTIDFGVLSDKSTTLIECNDGWSVGSYGLDGELIVKFLMDRWNQLINVI